MNKPWKIETCETCENQVGGYCRLNPPVPEQASLYTRVARYPVVQRSSWSMACAQYEEVS